MQRGSGRLLRLDKKAQVALFVVIAVILVAVIALLIFLKPEIGLGFKKINAPAYVESCIKDSASEAISLVSIHGGSIQPQEYATYSGRSVAFLCYTKEYYKRCTNLQPMLKYNVEDEIKNYVLPKVDKCINELKTNLDKQGYLVTPGILKLTTTIKPGKVVIDAEMPLNIEKGEEKQRFENYQVILLSPLYEQVMLAQEIVNSEITYGDFEQLTYMFENKQMDIDKTRYNEITFYILKSRQGGNEFVFAVRSAVTPPGF